MVAERANVCIERYLEVVGEFSIGTNLDIPTSKIGDLKTRPSNYGQTVNESDGATLCEVIIVTNAAFVTTMTSLMRIHCIFWCISNAPKYSADSH